MKILLSCSTKFYVNVYLKTAKRMVYHLLNMNLNSKELNKHWPDFYPAFYLFNKKGLQCKPQFMY